MVYFILIPIAIYTILYLTKNTDGFTNKPPMANFGTNIWRTPFDNSLREFDKRYKHLGVLNYPNHYTVTGEFIDDGPIHLS
jgi:hypothetical protein